MDDVARGHEEQGLEEGVREEVEEARRVGTEADGQEHVADLAHGRVGQHALDVGLDDGDGRCEQGRHGADDRHGVVGVGGDVVDGVHARDEVDARGDHGRGVDEGAHRGGAFHGVGEPGVEGDLGGLRDRADEK